MNTRNWRKIHRYLGLVIGIQLFLWTLSGLIFSWNSIEAVRGEHLIREQSVFDMSAFQLTNPQQAINDHAQNEPVASVNLRRLLDRPVYELTIQSNKNPRYVLVDAESGKKISPIGVEVAEKIAARDFAYDVGVKSVQLIESVGTHSEYRGKELPAFRVVMDHPTGTAIYVSADRGVVTTRRNNQWRLFDFFWMLHTMDYQGRDNFNSWLLKTLSIFGLVTVLSGFVLWIKTSKFARRKKKRQPGKLVPSEEE